MDSQNHVYVSGFTGEAEQLTQSEKRPLRENAEANTAGGPGAQPCLREEPGRREPVQFRSEPGVVYGPV